MLKFSRLLLLFITCAITSLFSYANTAKTPAEIAPDNIFPQVKLTTSFGVIVVELDRIKAPITVNNFLTYVVSGEYDNTVFHRIIADFIVQGGGYDLQYNEKKNNGYIINESGNGLKNTIGTIAMAKENPPHSANRQFYFNIADNKNLDPGRNWGYAVFGTIIEGQAVLDKIAQVPTDFNSDLNWPDVPIEQVVLQKAELLPAQ